MRAKGYQLTLVSNLLPVNEKAARRTARHRCRKYIGAGGFNASCTEAPANAPHTCQNKEPTTDNLQNPNAEASQDNGSKSSSIRQQDHQHMTIPENHHEGLSPSLVSVSDMGIKTGSHATSSTSTALQTRHKKG